MRWSRFHSEKHRHEANDSDHNEHGHVDEVHGEHGHVDDGHGDHNEHGDDDSNDDEENDLGELTMKIRKIQWSSPYKNENHDDDHY